MNKTIAVLGARPRTNNIGMNVVDRFIEEAHTLGAGIHRSRRCASSSPVSLFSY